MTTQVIDLFEVIEIDIEQRRLVPPLSGQLQNLRETTLQPQSIQKARQSVVMSEVGQLILIVDQLPLGALAGRDIAQHETGHFAVIHGQGARGDLNIDEIPVFTANEENPIQSRRGVNGSVHWHQYICVAREKQLVDIHPHELLG
jgi:hypothetical protein